MQRQQDLDDKIEVYTDENFNASAAAQRFFAQYGEQEIAKKLLEMNKIQQDIEIELKQNVKENYPAFLEATDQIHQVGSEMASLKHLIANTQKLINDARSTRLSDARVMRSNSLLPAINYRKARDEMSRQQSERAPQREIPSWLTKAADDLAQFIVEQQYAKAAAMVLKVRAYVEGLDRAASSLKAQQVLDVVNNRCEHLASTIKMSLLTLPHSPLWGSVEQFKRLKLLVSLGELAMAAEGFALLKRTNMQRALYSMDMSPEPLAAAQALSRSFYSELALAVHMFYQLFEQNQERKQVAVLIIAWIQAQVADYCRLLTKQLGLGVSETAALMAMHYRQFPDQQASSSSSHPEDAEEVQQEQRGRDSRASFRKPSVFRSPFPPSVTGGSGTGSISLVAQVLHIACFHCKVSQSQFNLSTSSSTSSSSSTSKGVLLLPMSSFVLFYCLTDMEKMLAAYAQVFIDDVSAQVRQDSWQSLKMTANKEQRLVSVSFLWVQSVLSHLLDEASVLLQGPSDPAALTPDDTSSSTSSHPSVCAYSRADVCELEVVLFSSWMRVLLRYLMELEALDLTGFTKAQLLCFHSTLLALSQLLLPSMLQGMDKVFLIERMQLLPMAPSAMFAVVSRRIAKLQSDAQQTASS